MGTSSHDNLGSDGAFDELHLRGEKLLNRILELAKNKRSREADEVEHDALFVDLEILFALESSDLIVCEFPPPEEIEALKLDYIAGWDAYIDKLEPKPDFKKKRRQHILDTFDKFNKICEQH